MPKIGVSIYSISRLIMSGVITPESAVEWLCQQGAQTIEIVPFGIDIIADEGLASRMKKVADEYGVPINHYSLNADFLQLSKEEYESEIARVMEHMERAKELGISTFRCDCAGYRRPIEENTIETFIEELPIITQTYETLSAYGEKLGIKVLIENHGFHVNGSERVRLVLKGVNSENFGHLLDVGNYICMDEDTVITTKKMIPFAKVIHMKDFYVRNQDPGDATQFDCSGSWFRSANGQYLRGSILGQGDMNIREIIKTIKHSGYEGDIFVEYEGMEDCYYGTKVSLDNLKRIYQEC